VRPYLAPGFFFEDPKVGFRPLISTLAPDALSGETVGLASFVGRKTFPKL